LSTLKNNNLLLSSNLGNESVLGVFVLLSSDLKLLLNVPLDGVSSGFELLFGLQLSLFPLVDSVLNFFSVAITKFIAVSQEGLSFFTLGRMSMHLNVIALSSLLNLKSEAILVKFLLVERLDGVDIVLFLG